MRNILVVPDVHVTVGDDLSRLKALGRYIVDVRPDYVIQLGDFADMYSLSGYDSTLKKAQIIGDYQSEVKSVHKGLKTLFKPLRQLQNKQRSGKRKLYKPKFIITLGNHENRYARVIEKDPLVLAKAIGIEDLHYHKYFDGVVPYKMPLQIADIIFTHHLTTMMGRPLGGAANPARTNLNRSNQSVVVGHSHLYDYATTTRLDGQRISALVAGCFIGDQKFDYAVGQQELWRDGVTMLHDVYHGEYDLEFVSTERLKRGYL